MTRAIRIAPLRLATLLAWALVSGCNPEPQPASARTTNPDSSKAVDQSPDALPDRPAAERPVMQPGEFTDLVPPTRQPQSIDVISYAVAGGPTIDGVADDAVWSSAPAVITLDWASQRDIHISSVHTDSEIFFLVTFPDAAPSITHKSWLWDPDESIYRKGNDREDMLVLKWSTSGNDANLSLFNNPHPHTADIWFWKACRTNPVGYADDKHQILGLENAEEAREIPTGGDDPLYLQRNGDAGRSAYTDRLQYEYAGDCVPMFENRAPEGSRADVRAKGRWDAGRWTIEFARALDTGHDDDIAFSVRGRYLFGVACYEMSFDKPNPQWLQPLYRCGDVFDRLYLEIRPDTGP